MNWKFVVIFALFPIAWIAPPASADYLEIFQAELKNGCTASQLQDIGDRFTAKFGAEVYAVEILTNQHGNAIESSVLWIGRSPSAAVWGEANDAFFAEAATGGDAAQLFADVFQCVSTVDSGSWRSVR